MTDPSALAAALADRYRIERELGAGGMATVYLAHDLKHDRPVALKVLRQELAATLGSERFHREIHIAAKLQHPNILPLHDSGEAGGFLYYVMPFVEGQSLRERLAREGALPVSDAVRILRDVVDALTEAHAHGVVHRDIKPENIMLRGHHALVTDFGVAKAVSEATGRQTLTTAGVALGTPAYMAPEQASADPHLDHRVDIYAVGAVGYELLTGRPVFMGTTPQMVLSAHVTETPAPITKYRETVPRSLEALVLRCLEKKPADRWQSAEELLPQLEALATPSGGITPTDTQPILARGPARRRVPLAVGIAGAVVLLAAAGLAVWSPWRHPAKPADVREPILVLPFETHVTSPNMVDIGALAADQIEAGIEAAELGTVKPRRSVPGASKGEVPSPQELNRIAQSSGAATLVTGVIYQRADSIEVQSQVVRARDLRTIYRLPAERSASASAQRALDATKERLLGAIGLYLSQRIWMTDVTQARPPSSLASFRAASRCYEVFARGNMNQAIAVCGDAYQRDTTGYADLWLLEGANWNLGRLPQADSLERMLDLRRSQMIPSELLIVDYSASLRQSPEQEYRAAMAGLATDTIGWTYSAVWSSLRANRPVEALRYYRLPRDTMSVWQRDWQAWYGVATAALHTLGRFDEELALADEARRRDPSSYDYAWLEARALVALGRLADVEQLLTASRALPDYRAPGMLMHDIAAELFEHGTKEQRRRMLDRALAWYSALPLDRRKDRIVRFEMATENYYLGRYAEAARLFADLAKQFPYTPLYVNAGARIAAAQGDTGAALRRIEALRTDTVRNNGIDIARIYAILGHKEEAVAALRDYLNHGGRFEEGGGFHANALELAVLRDYPAYQALVALKQ